MQKKVHDLEQIAKTLFMQNHKQFELYDGAILMRQGNIDRVFFESGSVAYDNLSIADRFQYAGLLFVLGGYSKEQAEEIKEYKIIDIKRCRDILPRTKIVSITNKSYVNFEDAPECEMAVMSVQSAQGNKIILNSNGQTLSLGKLKNCTDVRVYLTHKRDQRGVPQGYLVFDTIQGKVDRGYIQADFKHYNLPEYCKIKRNGQLSNKQ